MKKKINDTEQKMKDLEEKNKTIGMEMTIKEAKW